MNKKQQMVSELIDRIENAHVQKPNEVAFGDEMQLRAYPKYWEQFPDGHCRWHSVETDLACLSEDTLARILADDKIQEGMSWESLWHAWGRASYFNCAPSIIYGRDKHVPVLRMRHDCYLSWFRGYRFQMSMDICADGSNGESRYLNNIESVITAPVESIILDDSVDEDTAIDDWNTKWAVFRKALVYSLPFEACAGKRVFTRLLDNNPDMFDEFMTRTDQELMHYHLAEGIGIKQISRACREGSTIRYPLFTIPLLTSGNDKPKVCAVLALSEDRVSLTWSVAGKQRRFQLAMPKWDRYAYERQLKCLDLSEDVPSYPSESDYYYYCWTALAVVLITLAGAGTGRYIIDPYKLGWDETSSALYNIKLCAQGMSDIWDLCRDYCRRFRTLDSYTRMRPRNPRTEGVL